jgi:cytochrome P450
MERLEDRDFYTDPTVSDDPMPWIEAIRAKAPVVREAHHGSFVLTNFEDVAEVYARWEDFSNVATVGGPMVPLPFTPQNDDISKDIDRHRDHFMMSKHFITFDGDMHRAHRGLMTRLLTFKRLKANEAFMRSFANELIDAFPDGEHCELIDDYSQPLATMVIADLLGVPIEERAELREKILPAPGTMDVAEPENPLDPFAHFDKVFIEYLEDRRRTPRDDMLTDLTNSRLPDGSDPGVAALARVASFLFIGGQDTSAKLLASGIKILAEDEALQSMLRENRNRIPDFFEEVLRFESPTKSDFRIARRTTSIGGVEVKAGAIIMMSLTGANRDPSRFADPNRFDLDRKQVRDHIAFGRGPHGCPGAPLARLEAKIGLECLFDRFNHIAIDDVRHGPANARHYGYLPSYILRGLETLHLRFS